MKSLVLLALFVAFTHAQFTWLGTWNISSGCFETCCCPPVGTMVILTSNITNSSITSIIGDWMNTGKSNICKNMGLRNNGSYYPLPWGLHEGNVSDRYDFKGIEYNVVAYNDSNSNPLNGTITMDQTSVGGDHVCSYQLTYLSGTLLRVSFILMAFLSFIFI